MDQKCNIATRELDELREEIQRDQEEAEINYDNLRVSGWRHTDTYTHNYTSNFRYNGLCFNGSVGSSTGSRPEVS